MLEIVHQKIYNIPCYVGTVPHAKLGQVAALGPPHAAFVYKFEN